MAWNKNIRLRNWRKIQMAEPPGISLRMAAIGNFVAHNKNKAYNMKHLSYRMTVRQENIQSHYF